MLKAKAMGLNTICTYVFWNEHERERGQWSFRENLDIKAFVQLAQELGLWVLVRPGPYVCSEWDWGGLPYWLATVPDIKVRQNNPQFLELSGKYISKVGEQLADFTVERGGPILMVQVENEYGSFGADRDYMAVIKDQIIAAGFDGTLFTSDGPSPEMLEGGTLPGVTAVINFGSRPEERFAEFDKFRQNVPRMCGELWFGWFDHWGHEHHVTDHITQSKDLEWFMDTGASFSIYMLHGGTNWGFMNGANWTPDGYRPDVSSYDYDSAIAEDGRVTPKYHAFREVIGRFVCDLPAQPKATPLITLPEILFSESCLMRSLAGPEVQGWKSMEDLDQGYGYILYRLNFDSPSSGRLCLQGLQDYAVVLSQGKIFATLDRRLGETVSEIHHDGAMDILVENSGRINYAKEMLDECKGIAGATWNEEPITQVMSQAIAFESAVFSLGVSLPEPALYRAEFELKEVGDTHLDLTGWGKGNVWVNGFNLGRHWHIGPQRTLYCPGTLLKKGLNEVIVSDLEPDRKRSITGLADPILG